MKKATKFNLCRLADFIKVFGSNVRAVCPKYGVFKPNLDELVFVSQFLECWVG